MVICGMMRGSPIPTPSCKPLAPTKQVMPAPLSVSDDQVRWFRARQTGLAGSSSRAKSLADGARATIGIQSQQLSASLWGLAVRCAGEPTAEQVQSAVVDANPELVRIWGNRGTLHLYAPDDWRAVIASKPIWGVDGRRNVMPPDDLVEAAADIAAANGGRVLRSELMPMIRGAYLKDLTDFIGDQMDPKRLGASRLIWKLVVTGRMCLTEKSGAEQVYALRSAQFPELKWPRLSGKQATVDLARRFMHVCGPATVQDLAHYFGAKVATAQTWLEALHEELIQVQCGGREGLFALAADRRKLNVDAPQKIADWPVSLLPLWDGLLMSHADKSWTVLNEAERKLIWKKAAMVESVVLARGQVVAIWKHKQRAREVDVQIKPLGAWRKSKHLKSVEGAAEAFAAHHAKSLAKVEVAST